MHYSLMTPKEYHDEYSISERVCEKCVFASKQSIMSVKTVTNNPQSIGKSVPVAEPRDLHWCFLPKSRNFGTMVANFGTCDHFRGDEPEVD